jgi:hypothetical protein
MLFGVKKVTPAQMLQFAKEYEKAEMLNDAAEFYFQVKANEDLKRLLLQAESDGDVFLWLKVHRFLGDHEIDAASLGRCTDAAQKSGKLRYALLGYQKLENQPAADAIREQLKDDGDFQAMEEAEVFLLEHSEEISDSDIEE